MPTVLIWHPKGDNIYGHAALQTNKYHISMWPLRDGGVRYSELSTIGCLHFHEIVDRVEEGSLANPRGPTSRNEIVNVTNEDINCFYEKFLIDNGIDPREVTLEAAERYTDRTKCRKELPLTRYSLIGEVIVDKRTEKGYSDPLYFFKRCLTPGWGKIDICRGCIGRVIAYRLTRVNCPFYHKPQSCVSMCFNLIEMADRRDDVCLVEARNNTTKTLWFEDDICLQITVPNFEEHVVKKYWIKGAGQRVHYDSNDFQNESRYLMMSDIIFKKVFMKGPTIFFMAWLSNALNYSFLSLFGLSWIIHLIYFLLLFFVQVKLFTSVRLPKSVVYAGGLPCFAGFGILIAHYIVYSVGSMIMEACHVGDIEDCNLKLTLLMYSCIAYSFIRVCGYYFFVKIYELIFRFIVDASLKRRVYHSG